QTSAGGRVAPSGGDSFQAPRASHNQGLGTGAARSAAPTANLNAASGAGGLRDNPVHGAHISEVDEAQTDGMSLGGDGRLYDPSTPLSQVPAFQPNNAAPTATRNPSIQTNGIMTNATVHANALQDLANATGRSVVGVRNATNGIVSDLVESTTEKFGRESRPSQALTEVINNQLTAGHRPDLHAHSQGAIINSSALQQVQQGLQAAGRTPDQVRQDLSAISLSTYGGAAQTFVDGPAYTHNINRLDPVSRTVGLNNGPSPLNGLTTAPGLNADVNRYTDVYRNPHGFDNYVSSVYGPHAAPNPPGLDPKASTRPGLSLDGEYTTGGMIGGGGFTTGGMIGGQGLNLGSYGQPLDVGAPAAPNFGAPATPDIGSNLGIGSNIGTFGDFGAIGSPIGGISPSTGDLSIGSGSNIGAFGDFGAIGSPIGGSSVASDIGGIGGSSIGGTSGSSIGGGIGTDSGSSIGGGIGGDSGSSAGGSVGGDSGSSAGGSVGGDAGGSAGASSDGGSSGSSAP
ncbi:MAG TPA: hypothetical protein VK447_17015, partial [Myxococcaceae bacterium]|nr:hypothetical protein [Myxococcaceae bacterium]